MNGRNKKYFVTVVGNIGVGKTTFAEQLGKKLDWKVYYEKVIDNPYLPDYYKNMRKWSFHLQIYFFSHRFKEQLEIARSEISCIQDRSIYEDPEIFARVLHRQGHLPEREYRTYRELFDNLSSLLPHPDLFIYLRASTWTLMSRIRKRGREFEKGITAEFLHLLNMAYESWIKRLKQHEKVLIINTDEFDIDRDVDKLDHYVHIIWQMLESNHTRGVKEV